jgi:signal transduction histidine kinase
LLWIGTRGRGLWMYDGRRFTQFDATTYGLPSNFINSVYKDDADRLWLGFANGASVLENDTFKVLPVKNITVVSFLSIGADSMLIATDRNNGLLLYHDGKVAEFATNTAADSSTIQCFVKDGNDLWLGSSDNGVVRYNMVSHKAIVINENSGLRSDFIYNIIEGSNGDMWVGTGFGIHRIRMISAKDADGQLVEEPEITFYGKAHGITGMESNINSVLKLPDESIWFGTTNGAVHYQPNTTVVSSQPSSIVLLSVKLTGEPMIPESYFDSSDSWYGVPYHLKLPSRKNNLSFTFQAIAPGGAEQVLYRYRMDGLEAPWSDWSQVNTASYSALPPGRYVLHVQCRGADDQHVKELTYAFVIITPLHKTTWFRILVLATCIMIGIGLQYALHNARQRRQRLLARLRTEEQDKIRVSTAEDFHDEIGNKLTRISVLTNVLKTKLPPDTDTLRILGQIEDNTAQLYSGTRDILWSLKPSNDTLYEVLVRIRDFGMELFQDTEVTFSFDGIDEAWQKYRLPINLSRNLIMIFKEALNNSLKYARANKVWIQVSMTNDDTLELLLKDDGTGFDLNNVHRGNGMNNMEIRAGRLSGKLVMESEKGRGTCIRLAFKIPPKR